MENNFRLNETKVWPRVSVAVPHKTPLPRTAGGGFLAGSFPDGLTTVEGVPVAAEIIVRLRTETPGAPGDGCMVAHTFSSPSGEWLVPNLSTAKRYDVFARLVGECDALQSDITPHTT